MASPGNQQCASCIGTLPYDIIASCILRFGPPTGITHRCHCDFNSGIELYTVSQKKARHQTLAHNFPKC